MNSNPPTDRTIRAPWSSEQVTALNAFQHHGRMHPFTCAALHASGQSPMLVATHSGWVCPDGQCTYRQDWAHAFMAAPAAAVVAPPPATRAETAEALRSDLYDDLDAFARETQIPGLQHAQIRDHLAVFLTEGLLRRLAVEAQQQPDTETEAHPPTHTWKVESPRRDKWASWGATHDERVWAAASYEDVIAVAPQRAFRLVRATTTYVVEAEHQPAAGVRQDGAQNRG